MGLPGWGLARSKKTRVIRQTVNTWTSDIRTRQKTNRNSIIIRLSRLGWSQEMIAKEVGLSQNRVSEIIGNTNFSEIDNLLSQGRDMEYIAKHYNMDLPLVWALRLEGKINACIGLAALHGFGGCAKRVNASYGSVSRSYSSIPLLTETVTSVCI